MRTWRTIVRGTVLAAGLAIVSVRGAEVAPRLEFDSFQRGRFELAGPVGERVRANVEHWLLPAPQSNPGMIEMFRLRDRQPVPQLVPWAGEFIGKYLISAIQALRMSADPRLRDQVSSIVAEFIATQAEDGYLGPFPRAERLLKHWDLWGHYHAILALVMWHEHSGDTVALAAACRAGDLVCATYLDTGRRVADAGDSEMNMAILTGLAMLHRITGEPRYLRLAREVERDWEGAGDYLRAGLDGREFFQSPRPRWESLHSLQGLVELWRLTGDARYRAAFEHHWRSIRRWDRRNTGGFSSGEQATGNPYAPTAIETCCTVAWMAVTLDYLRLTGDPRAADELELATLNGGLGAQHPSGRWWTYSTPMDGVREASAHTIVFQARAGTPELNCCSVNAPRVLGSLSEWAFMESGLFRLDLLSGHEPGGARLLPSHVTILGGVARQQPRSTGTGRFMESPTALVVNSYLPGRFTLPGRNGSVTLDLDRNYPASGSQRVSVAQAGDSASEWTLRLRIPGWSKATRLAASFPGVPEGAVGGSYLDLRRRWAPGDEIVLSFDTDVRVVPGANDMEGKVSLYSGPLLLAYDQAENSVDDGAIPPIELDRLSEARRLPAVGRPGTTDGSAFDPWLRVDVPAVGGQAVRLVDFASAGSRGTRYRSWLPAKPVPVPAAFTQRPPDAARIPPGPTSFQWRGTRATDVRYRVEFSRDQDFGSQGTWSTNVTGLRLEMDTMVLAAVAPEPASRIWWRVITRRSGSEAAGDVPPAWFRLDRDAPPLPPLPDLKTGPNGEIIMHSLRGADAPVFGTLKKPCPVAPDADGTELNGRDQMLVYAVPVWPEQDYTVRVRVRLRALPGGRIGQVFSAWAAGMDDPLRLVIEKGQLHARLEAGGAFSTPGTTLETGRWYDLVAVKQGCQLSLYTDGVPIGSCPVPEWIMTQARDCALGGNPRFAGNEFLAARFADFAVFARALAEDEIRGLTSSRSPRADRD